MTYGLNFEKPSFSYTREELFSCITKIVCHPHTHITSHDQSRALAIMLVLEDYLANFTHRDGEWRNFTVITEDQPLVEIEWGEEE